MLLHAPFPFEDNSVSEAHTSHFVEHLTGPERIHFVNELYRVLVPGGKCTMITPHWASCRAYGDLTHQWPPVSEFWFYYLSKEWRKANAPHNDAYTCDFDCTWGYIPHPEVAPRNQEYQMYAFNFLKEAIQDIQATLVKK
jgi:SAM-dependent methyltransferase